MIVCEKNDKRGGRDLERKVYSDILFDNELRRNAANSIFRYLGGKRNTQVAHKARTEKVYSKYPKKVFNEVSPLDRVFYAAIIST